MRRTTRRYVGETLILETQFETETGVVEVIDFMTGRRGTADLVRIVRGVRGSVKMRTEIVICFEYGSVVPWVERTADGRYHFVAGPDRLVLCSDAPLNVGNVRTTGEFEIEAGQEIACVLTWTPSWRQLEAQASAQDCLEATTAFWTQWAKGLKRPAAWRSAILRSVLTLKALSHADTGGIVAAATTSLPERIGGQRNWDYRFCWLRDATLTLYALIGEGFLHEAEAWRRWLLRAVAGSPSDLRILYGVAGERRIVETELPWLPGYENSSPVRIGNAAIGQLQLDVYGEVIDALYVGRKAGLSPEAASWALESAMIAHLETIWDQPDEGIWEVRGPRRHFTHSKVMAWVAFDRGVRSIEEFGLEGPLERWREIRDRIHREVCERGYDSARDTFVQAYGSSALDASLLMLAIVGFLPADDSRISGTVAAIEKHLMRDGLVYRYDSEETDDGLPAGESAFIACSFWLADNYVMIGRYEDAKTLFEHLLTLRNDVGLLAEEYDPVAKRQLGNFPQAFSHLSLINTARNLLSVNGPAKQRAEHSPAPES